MLQQWGIISSSAQETSWTQPVLSDNGTLGGSSFAVAADSEYSTTYAAWKAFDNSESTHWRGGKGTSYITIYNPNPIKISSIYVVHNNVSVGQYLKAGYVSASTNNTDYTNLVNYTNPNTSYGTFTITVNSSSFYNYYRIAYTSTNNSSYSGFTELNITATQRTNGANSTTFPTSYTNTAYAFSLGFINENNTAYATNKITTGMNLYNPSSSNGMANWYTIGY